MAATQRIPDHRGRRRACRWIQNAQAAQVALFALTAALLFTGCQSNPFARETTSVPAPRFHTAERIESVADKGQVSLMSYQQDDVPGVEELSGDSSSRNQNFGRQDAVDDDEVAPPDPTKARIPSLLQRDSDTNFDSNSAVLTLDQVLASVSDCYPEIEIAIGEIVAASGKAYAAQGAFDDILSGHSISQPLGFYQTYRNGLGLTRPLFNGGEVFSTYRIGDGNFEPWFGERETNEGGEFKAGFSVPLVKDRNIDARRAKLFAAELQQLQVESNVEARLLLFQLMASQIYWDWVVSGRVVEVQERLIELAELRVDQIKTRIEAGDLAEIAQIDNDRFIAARKNTLIRAQRSLEKSAIKLSLFLRDSNCEPFIADDGLLPTDFPGASRIAMEQLQDDIGMAIALRPELAELRAARRETCVDLRYARNLTLPKVDVKGFAGQDVGGETSSLGDKTPFELQLGVLAEVPLQRREGLGKIEAAQGKLTQIDAKIRFTTDKIRAEIQDAASAVNAAYEQIQQSRENLRLTQRSLELGRVLFEEGDIDLIALNIYETSVADAALFLLEAQFKYHIAQAAYTAALSNNQLR